MNYLQLCQELVSELGLSGGTGPSSVTGQRGELNNVTRWIRDSALAIDNLWLDWKYLWCRYSCTAAQFITNAPTTLPAPANGVLVRLWDNKKMRFRPPGGTWQDLPYVTRSVLESSFDPDDAPPQAPQAYTILPDNSIQLSAPLDKGYDFKSEFWRRPTVLSANSDVPLMPADFHRIIVTRAAVYYGNREDAPEIIAGMEAEYMDALDKLQSDQLENQSLRRTSTDRDSLPEHSRLDGFVV